MCFAPRYMNAPTAVPRFACTNEASRFDTLCAATAHGHSATANIATIIAPATCRLTNNRRFTHARRFVSARRFLHNWMPLWTPCRPPQSRQYEPCELTHDVKLLLSAT